MTTQYRKPNGAVYALASFLSYVIKRILFHPKTLRNELKGVKGPYVLLCNHECKMDFVYVFGLNKNRHTLVMSKSMLETLPIANLAKKIGVIEKQQFQTSLSDMRRIQNTVKASAPLVLYPAGLMTENGMSTPIPSATYKLIKWLNADVYVARVYGSYFVMPKWSKRLRSGKTEIDVYRLIKKEELSSLSLEEIRQRTDEALLFDAYAEQEKRMFSYRHGNDLSGLENVVYACPHCKREFTIAVKGRKKDTIYCTECGYSQTADRYGFLHATKGQEEIRHVSIWDKRIYDDLKKSVEKGETASLCCPADFCEIDEKKHRFEKRGEGELLLERTGFTLKGWKEKDIFIPTGNICILPSSPGKYIEVQDGERIYRCVLKEGKYVEKYLHLLKIFYEMNNGVNVKYTPKGE